MKICLPLIAGVASWGYHCQCGRRSANTAEAGWRERLRDTAAATIPAVPLVVHARLIGGCHKAEEDPERCLEERQWHDPWDSDGDKDDGLFPLGRLQPKVLSTTALTAKVAMAELAKVGLPGYWLRRSKIQLQQWSQQQGRNSALELLAATLVGATA